MINLILISIAAILTENFVLVKFLGCCPFIGVSGKTGSAVGMGVSVIFTMTVASAVTWPVYHFALVPLGLEYMKTVVFVLIIAAIVQLIELFMQKKIPSIYSALGIYLPLITTNCAVLGVALLNISKDYSFIESVVYGFAAGVGFLLAIFLMSLIRERINYADIPGPFRGYPIILLAAALLSMAFMGFRGMSLPF